MEEQKGVIKAVSGYMGGDEPNPTYSQVSAHKTGHAETVEVVFDTRIVTYEELATLFFNIHDPTQSNGQGPDIGPQYRSAIFYSNNDQKIIAQTLIDKLKRRGYKVVTKVAPAKKFWPAEDYHQDYYEGNHKTPYCHYITDRFK
jgi:peptide methionine sulfoxide reductase msrA/msrB